MAKYRVFRIIDNGEPLWVLEKPSAFRWYYFDSYHAFKWLRFYLDNAIGGL